VDERPIRSVLDEAARPGPPRLILLTDPVPPGARVGLVPGSFDPMTVAHAALADALLADGADVVVLTYSPRTMPKEGPAASEPPLLAPERRVASMVAFAGPRPQVAVALTSHGLYADQAEAASGAFPGSHLTFAIGSDKLVQLAEPGWYGDRDVALGRLFARAEVRYAMRAGDREPVRDALRSLDRWAGGIRPLDVPPAVAGISSTAVRRAIREGSDVRGVVPREVLPYVAS
jgi:nicotinamide-nucleotide adenylyltransferase